MRRLLHHGIVDRDRRRCRERHGVEAAEVEIGLRECEGLFDAREHIRPERPEFREERRRLQHEHPAVPVVVARRDHALGRRTVGLLDEAADRERAFQARHAGAAVDVAVARLGRVRDDAERREQAGGRGVRGEPDRAMERCDVADRVVGREHEQQRIGVVLRQCQRSGGDGGCGVATDRFEQQQARLHAEIAELFGDEEAMLLVADHDRRFDAVQAVEACDGFLEHRAVIARQTQELFGIGAARQRPQAGAGAAAEDDGMDFHGLRWLRRRLPPGSRRDAARGVPGGW